MKIRPVILLAAMLLGMAPASPGQAKKPSIPAQDTDRSVTINAKQAALKGGHVVVEKDFGNIGYWKSESDVVTLPFRMSNPEYERTRTGKTERIPGTYWIIAELARPNIANSGGTLTATLTCRGTNIRTALVNLMQVVLIPAEKPE